MVELLTADVDKWRIEFFPEQTKMQAQTRSADRPRGNAAATSTLTSTGPRGKTLSRIHNPLDVWNADG